MTNFRNFSNQFVAAAGAFALSLVMIASTVSTPNTGSSHSVPAASVSSIVSGTFA